MIFSDSIIASVLLIDSDGEISWKYNWSVFDEVKAYE